MKVVKEKEQLQKTLDSWKDSSKNLWRLINSGMSSSIKQFWQTATATTLADGTLELKATIDTIEYTITEACIRSKLQLADASRITMFDQKQRDFEGKGHMGYPTDGIYIFGNMKRGFKGVPRPLLPAMLSIVDLSAGQEAPSVTQPQPSSTVVPPTPPTTQPIPSEAITIPPLSQPAPPTPIAETTTASPSPSPSPAHEPMEHTFEQPSTDQQPPTPRQEATTSQLMTRIGDLEKQLKETKQTFGKAILTLRRKNQAQGEEDHDLDPLVLWYKSFLLLQYFNASGRNKLRDKAYNSKAAAILNKSSKDQFCLPLKKIILGIKSQYRSSTTEVEEKEGSYTEEAKTQASRKKKDQILKKEAGLQKLSD
ncbi:hypothetical protein Tco_1247442 [Tanacetum coccineum]